MDAEKASTFSAMGSGAAAINSRAASQMQIYGPCSAARTLPTGSAPEMSAFYDSPHNPAGQTRSPRQRDVPHSWIVFYRFCLLPLVATATDKEREAVYNP